MIFSSMLFLLTHLIIAMYVMGYVFKRSRGKVIGLKLFLAGIFWPLTVLYLCFKLILGEDDGDDKDVEEQSEDSSI